MPSDSVPSGSWPTDQDQGSWPVRRRGRPAPEDTTRTSMLLRELGEVLYILKAGPAGGLRPPSGPPTTRRSPWNRPYPPSTVLEAARLWHVKLTGDAQG